MSLCVYIWPYQFKWIYLYQFGVPPFGKPPYNPTYLIGWVSIINDASWGTSILGNLHIILSIDISMIWYMWRHSFYIYIYITGGRSHLLRWGIYEPVEQTYFVWGISQWRCRYARVGNEEAILSVYEVAKCWNKPHFFCCGGAAQLSIDL